VQKVGEPRCSHPEAEHNAQQGLVHLFDVSFWNKIKIWIIYWFTADILLREFDGANAF